MSSVRTITNFWFDSFGLQVLTLGFLSPKLLKVPSHSIWPIDFLSKSFRIFRRENHFFPKSFNSNGLLSALGKIMLKETAWTALNNFYKMQFFKSFYLVAVIFFFEKLIHLKIIFYSQMPFMLGGI